jgi:hypothetical protein
MNESLATCKKGELKMMQKLSKNKKHSERTRVINLMINQKAKTLQKQLIQSNWSQFLPLLRRNPQITKCMIHTRHLGKSMISLMILKITQNDGKKQLYGSECDQLALSALREMVEQFEAVFPNETHLRIMKTRAHPSRTKEWKEVPPLHIALRNGLIETARAITKMNSMVTLELPTVKVTALDQVILALQVQFSREGQLREDPLMIIKFIVEELKEPLIGTALFSLISIVPQLEIVEVFRYLLSKGYAPGAFVEKSDLLILLMFQSLQLLSYEKHLKNAKREYYLRIVDLLIDSGAVFDTKVPDTLNVIHFLGLPTSATSEQVITEYKRHISWCYITPATSTSTPTEKRCGIM